MNYLLLENTCRLNDGDNLRWLGHSNLTHNNLICLNIHIRKVEVKHPLSALSSG